MSDHPRTEPPRLPSDVPLRACLGPWLWIFLSFFLVLGASTAYFALQRTPLARRLDASRSALLSEGPLRARAHVYVLDVPDDGQVRARPVAPESPGADWQVLVEWSPEVVDRRPGHGHERTLTAELPRVVAVEVIDTRGPVPEHMRLVLDDGGTR